MARGIPFKPGNQFGRGRPRGSRNKKTRLEELLRENGELIIRKGLLMAAQGDRVAMRLCFERLLPAPRTAPASFHLPKAYNAADLAKTMEQVMQIVGRGQLTPEQGQQVLDMLKTYGRALETVEFDQRLRALEEIVRSPPGSDSNDNSNE